MVSAVRVRKTEDFDVPGLGQQIEAVRKADGRSLQAISDAAGMTRQHWREIELGNVKTLPWETLQKMQQVLGVTLLEDE